MWKRLLLISALFAGWTQTSATAKELTIGDGTPSIDVKEFVKGEPVASLEKGKTYVLEFWATWCGPCRVSIPHLTELQKKYKDVVFIGVSVWESDQSAVKPFVEKMADKMDYRVAMDLIPEGGKRNDGKMAQQWMEAASQDGIPTAFIVNTEGKIAWIGHPMKMETPLQEITAGTWNLANAAKEHNKAIVVRKKLRDLQVKLAQAKKSTDPNELLRILDETIADSPDLESQLASLKFQMLLGLEGSDKAVKYGTHLSEKIFRENAQALNAVAWTVVDPKAMKKRDAKLLQLALKVAQQADTMVAGKDAAIADTLAKVYFDNDQPAKALEVQERAVALAKGTALEKDESLKERLEQYRKAVMK